DAAGSPPVPNSPSHTSSRRRRRPGTRRPRARTRTSAAARPRARRALARPARRTWGTRRDRAARRGVRGRLGRRAGRTERESTRRCREQRAAWRVPWRRAPLMCPRDSPRQGLILWPALRRSLPMRLSLRFIIPLFLVLGAIAYAVVPLVDRLTLQWFERDLDSRASLVANTVQEPLETLVRAGNRAGMLEFFTRITQDERLYAMAFCPAGQGEAVATPTLPATIRCDELDSFSGPSGHLLRSRDGPLLVSVRQLAIQGARTGRLVLVHDMSFIARRSEETRKYLFLFFIGLGGTVSLLTVVIAQLSWPGTREWSAPTGSRTSTCGGATRSRCGGPRAAWSPPWSRSCGRARARGSRTAGARPTARSWTSTTGSPCRPSVRPISCAGSG